MGRPPSEWGACHVRLTIELPGVPDTESGGPGVVGMVMVAVGDDGELMPAVLEQDTMKESDEPAGMPPTTPVIVPGVGDAGDGGTATAVECGPDVALTTHSVMGMQPSSAGRCHDTWALNGSGVALADVAGWGRPTLAQGIIQGVRVDGAPVPLTLVDEIVNS